jgi:hypothetical protein
MYNILFIFSHAPVTDRNVENDLLLNAYASRTSFKTWHRVCRTSAQYSHCIVHSPPRR